MNSIRCIACETCFTEEEALELFDSLKLFLEEKPLHGRATRFYNANKELIKILSKFRLHEEFQKFLFIDCVPKGTQPDAIEAQVAAIENDEAYEKLE